MRPAWLILPVFLLACGGDELPPVKSPPPPPATSVEDQRPPPGTLWRHEVDAVVEEGFGAFLRFLLDRMEWQELLDERGKFTGWEVVHLYRDGFWTGIDLREGDVVTAVNGKPLERETQAHDAFTSLKQADEIVISLLRDGERMDLMFKIAKQPGRKPPPKQAQPSSAPTDSHPGGKTEWPSADKPMPGTGGRPQSKKKE